MEQTVIKRAVSGATQQEAEEESAPRDLESPASILVKLKGNGDHPDRKRGKGNGDGADGKGVKGNGDNPDIIRMKGNGDDSDDSDDAEGISMTRMPLVGHPRRSATLSLASQRSETMEIRRDICLRIAATFSIVTAMILLVVVIYMATNAQPMQYCNFKDNVLPRNLKSPDVFDDMTPDEYDTVRDFMLNQKSLGIVPFSVATINSSYIFLIELHPPLKEEVTQYLDNGSKKPHRVAKVVVVRGDAIPPMVEEYLVSPIDEPSKMAAISYKNPSYRRNPIPYTSRPIDEVDYKFIFQLIEKVSEELYPLLMESYGLCYHNCTQGVNCMVWYDVAPRGRRSGERRSWTWGFPYIDGFYIHPLGLEMLINHESTDVSKWGVDIIVYNGQMFKSLSSLMDAYRAKTLNMIHLHKDDIKYSSYRPRGDLPQKPIQGPQLTEPEGKRFSVDGRHVTYKDWDFHMRMRASTGLQLFNVQFNGQRIAYEISLQEVLVLYSGFGPAQSNTNYYDASWMLGASNMELARGFDCPETAIFLDSYFFVNKGKTTHTKNNICIFENNPSMPLRRHYAKDPFSTLGYQFYGGIPDYSLVVRTVANVWNYDYLFDYIFHLNGAIEIKATATGYVQSTFALPQEKPFGSVIHDHVMADLHQHVFNYKFDLDIAGDRNRFTALDIGLETVRDPWRQEFNRTRMKINRSLKSKEQDCLTIDANTPSYHIFHNVKAKNRVGEARAYRILNKAPLNLLSEGIADVNSAYWAKYPILVTKRKDEEDMSTSIYAQNDPWDPILNFGDFVEDDDSLVDQDLVAWVTIGTHHIPGSEDVPSTPTAWNQYSIFLQPHNFFDECPSVHSTDSVYIKASEAGPVFETSGASYKASCIPNNIGPFEFNGTDGEL